MAKTSRFPSLAVLHKAAKVANDTVYKYGHIIHRTIDQLEKAGFSTSSIFDMVKLRLRRWQNGGLKRFEIIIIAPRMSVGYYWGGKCFSQASSLSRC
jgi:hypothetical protein